MKTTNQILEQKYMSANDLMKVIPNLTYDNAIKYINKAREEMIKENQFIPITRPKLALTSTIRKMFGF